MASESIHPEVIIIGGGMAGLSAGALLAEAGKRVLLLEASRRLGGRIFSQNVAEIQEPIELGAEFIHGRPEELLRWLANASLESYALSGSAYGWDGSEVKQEDEERDFSLLERIAGYNGADLSFAAYLKDQQVDEETGAMATSYVEGFNAADAREISVRALALQQTAEDAIDGDQAGHVRRGYSALTDATSKRLAAAGGRIRLGSEVTQVCWSQGRVLVSGRDFSMEAPRLIVAIPLGVLQAGAISFNPAPASYNALGQMAMGPVHRISLVFRERFWSSRGRPFDDMSFLFAQQGLPAVWWTAYPSKTPVLTGWVGGRRVAEVAASDLRECALTALCRIFSMERRELEGLLLSTHTHDWNNDPLFRGAYSYVRTGGVNASRTLSEPVGHTLFMAGEHTDVTGHWGTVHGALRSGIRAAGQVLRSLAAGGVSE